MQTVLKSSGTRLKKKKKPCYKVRNDNETTATVMAEPARWLVLAAQLLEGRRRRGGGGGGGLAFRHKKEDTGILKGGPGCLWNQCSGPAHTRLFWHCGWSRDDGLHPSPPGPASVRLFRSSRQKSSRPLGPKTQVCSHPIHGFVDVASPSDCFFFFLFLCFFLRRVSDNEQQLQYEI